MSAKNSISRTGVGIALAVQAACLVFLVAAANYVSFRHYARWDFSRSQKFSLADQTKRVLRELKAPVKVTVYLSPTDLGLGAMLFRDVDNLLKEYRFSGRDRIEVERVDPSRDLARARELQSKFGFGENESLLVIEFDGRSKFVPVAEMGEFDFSGAAIGDPPRLVAFRGEQVLTSALVELLKPEQKKIYFLTGHGERTPARGGLDILAEYLARQNIDFAELDLGTVDRVPGDAAAICVIAPRFDLQARELGILERYWDSTGRMLVLVDPDAPTPGLEGFLVEKGIVPLDARVLRTAESPALPGVTAIWRIVPGKVLPGSAITKRFEGVNTLFDGSTQPLLLNAPAAAASGIRLRPLVEAVEGFWGEADHGDMRETGARFDDGRDTPPPLVLAASAERGATADDRVDVAASALVVVANPDFASDEIVSQSPANLDFCLSAINWMLDRAKLTGVAPKAVTTFRLSLSDAQMARLWWWTVAAMPAVAAAFGLLVAWRRRA